MIRLEVKYKSELRFQFDFEATLENIKKMVAFGAYFYWPPSLTVEWCDLEGDLPSTATVYSIQVKTRKDITRFHHEVTVMTTKESALALSNGLNANAVLRFPQGTVDIIEK